LLGICVSRPDLTDRAFCIVRREIQWRGEAETVSAWNSSLPSYVGWPGSIAFHCRRLEIALNKGRINSKNATNNCIITAGEIFGDGAMIELIASSAGLGKPDVLLWNGGKATVGPRINYGGCIYEASKLTQSLHRALRLPAQCRQYGSARDLFAGIVDLFNRHLHFSDWESQLLAAFSMSTWLTDRMSIAPSLMVSTPDQQSGVEVSRLLSCVCRRPLMLAELTSASFRSLPLQLSPTLLIHQESLKPSMLRSLRASSYRGLYLVGGGTGLVDLCGPKAIFCSDDSAVDALGEGAIHIAVAPSQLKSPALGEQQRDKIATDFQSRLLMYRLKNHAKVDGRQGEVAEFTFATGQLASTLASCFPEDWELARDVVRLLRTQSDEAREKRFRDVNYVIVEILWALVHDRKRKAVNVNELAKDVGVLLQSRGEAVQYSAEEVGWKLRQLSIPRHTDSSGRQVVLNFDTSRIVHRCARIYDLPCARDIQAKCPDCSTVEVSPSK
jgi:hypothetical protein